MGSALPPAVLGGGQVAPVPGHDALGVSHAAAVIGWLRPLSSARVSPTAATAVGVSTAPLVAPHRSS